MTHQKKAGTPTMGGLLILCLEPGGDPAARQPAQYLCLARGVRHGELRRDRLRRRLSEARARTRAGLSGRTKFAWSFVMCVHRGVVALSVPRLRHHLTIPFVKNVHPDLRWWGYIPFAMLVIVGSSHAVNLTDGLDGLAIGPVMTVAFTYWVFTYVAGNLKFATYLQIPHVVGRGRGRDLLRGADRGLVRISLVQRVSGIDDNGRRGRAGAGRLRSGWSRCWPSRNWLW